MAVWILNWYDCHNDVFLIFFNEACAQLKICSKIKHLLTERLHDRGGVAESQLKFDLRLRLSFHFHQWWQKNVLIVWDFGSKIHAHCVPFASSRETSSVQMVYRVRQFFSDRFPDSFGCRWPSPAIFHWDRTRRIPSKLFQTDSSSSGVKKSQNRILDFFPKLKLCYDTRAWVDSRLQGVSTTPKSEKMSHDVLCPPKKGPALIYHWVFLEDGPTHELALWQKSSLFDWVQGYRTQLFSPNQCYPQWKSTFCFKVIFGKEKFQRFGFLVTLRVYVRMFTFKNWVCWAIKYPWNIDVIKKVQIFSSNPRHWLGMKVCSREPSEKEHRQISDHSNVPVLNDVWDSAVCERHLYASSSQTFPMHQMTSLKFALTNVLWMLRRTF